MFQGSSGDLQIHTVVTEHRAELPPTTSSCKIERQNPVAIEIDNMIEPQRQHKRKLLVFAALQNNATLDLAHTDNADKKIGVALAPNPPFDIDVAPPLGQRRKGVGVDQEHQNSTSRGSAFRRSNSTSP